MTALDSWVTWREFEDERVTDSLASLAGRASRQLVSARCADVQFYAHHLLVELKFAGTGATECVYGLDSPDRTMLLDGTSAPIHETNESESLILTDETVEDYVRFFFFFVRSDSGTFVLIESPEDIDLHAPEETDGGEPESDPAERLRELRAKIKPLRIRANHDHGGWVVQCAVAYDGSLFVAKLEVSPGGEVEMLDDDPIATIEGLLLPEYPPLAATAELSASRARDAGANGRGDVAEAIASRRSATGAEELTRDRDVTEAIVAVLLEDAIAEREGDAARSSMLLAHFNAEIRGEKPIDRLRRLVVDSVPVIIIESDVPFVEDFVAGLIDGPDQAVSGGAVSRARVAESDELRCVVSYDSSAKLQLLSFHAYRGLYDAERTAHELALRDVTVLIGCERAADVPEPLRRIADLGLTFPRIDRGRFARIFERVFGARPAADWDAPGADWTRYLVPADFHTPRRLGLDGDQSLRFLRERVQSRLQQVTPDPGPRLSELHGLGEARQICEDFLADVHAAQAAQIPWSAVDRGLLLVGAPGTGKTTLARALAKECGIKFIVASAARWQSAGALDSHLQAMRADFTEARRYAPAILFIDEIDSIGSREMLGGDRNVIYQTEVINALLEQIQGIDTADPVIVIGATNYLERVDPALRRSGRLDQAVQLPLPSIPSLEQIYSYYLGPYRADELLDEEVDTHTLAALSLGLTGADVEFFVRGAARRARRASRKIAQEDLTAEVTRRPRRPDSAPRLAADEMRRVAVHEAGHAVARLISSTRGDDITFVTIIPRMDGSLGFVASVPADGYVVTRRAITEQLETVLAGRAAEELVFGADDIGTGAGGPSRDSDLAVATRTATVAVCQGGLGDDGALHWTEKATPAQEKQIDTALAKAYSSIVARLQDRRWLLDRIVEILERKQELSGTELRALLAEPSPAGAS
jgi:AAA+ superfamily predicted ATPase